jgi:hypothetical protein
MAPVQALATYIVHVSRGCHGDIGAALHVTGSVDIAVSVAACWPNAVG